ncbi:MAG: DsrH/TusB family sulfur relay protein [Firmicutes bacterium]|nr:DsrH/TusB family sulfur relay protein [Bacillota bacterium]
MALYLLDGRYTKLGLDLAKNDPNAKVVLIQDGVYADISSLADTREVYFIKDDLAKRGMELPHPGAKVISYPDLIDLIEQEKIYNFV